MKVLVTGTAGFIGFHLARRLLEEGNEVIGLDNINDYYDVRLKYARLKETGILEGETEYGRLVSSKKYVSYRFIRLNLEDRERVFRLFEVEQFDCVVHLAAQAGVRYSLEHPYAYIDSNVYGFMNILEGSRHHPVRHVLFASSSSVYGGNRKMPFSVKDNVDHPVCLYAATKKANELMAHTYSALYNIPATGLRFFTVYGPWGRPDMAYFRFARAIMEGKPIDVYNYGRMRRDFTYIDDAIESVVRLMRGAPGPDPSWNGENPSPSSSFAPYRIYNIGNSEPVDLMHLIGVLETCLGKKAKINFLPMQPGEVPETHADIEDLVRDTGFRPETSIEEGIKRFVEWYRSKRDELF